MDPVVRKSRFEIPRVLLEAFEKQPRIVLNPAPGLWPVDPEVLHSLVKVAENKEFKENFEIMVVPR
jgi:hypothetical protein